MAAENDAEPAPPTIQQIIGTPVVLTVPGMEEVEVRTDLEYHPDSGANVTADLYLPSGPKPDHGWPVVVLIHGGPIPPAANAKSWAIFRSYGRLLAASGLAAVTFNHRFHSPAHLPTAAADVEALLTSLGSQAARWGVDAGRLALWAFSGGGPFLSTGLAGQVPGLRALVAYYAVLDLEGRVPGTDPSVLSAEERARFSPRHQLARSTEADRRVPPLLVVRAGKDSPELNATVDRFVTQALAVNAELDLLTHPTGRHGFDILDPNERSRELLRRTIAVLKARLESIEAVREVSGTLRLGRPIDEMLAEMRGPGPRHDR